MQFATVMILIFVVFICYVIMFNPPRVVTVIPYTVPVHVLQTETTYELEFDNIKVTEMKEINKNDYAYVTLLFPSITNGVKGYKFLLGMLVVAYLLKHNSQNYDLMTYDIHSTKAAVVCLVTPDVDNDVIEILNLFYDRVIKVPYITPSFIKVPYITPSHIESVDSIKISDVTKAYHANDHCYNKVMTKLNIFNPSILPYKKIIFVDGDMLPLNFFDSLFSLEAPAGWLETYRCNEDPHLSHGIKIPRKYTDIEKEGVDVNASLMVIEPNRETYNDMIAELQSPLKMWFGEGKMHSGMWFNNRFNDFYMFPEQDYLTKRFSGDWTYIDNSFCSCIESTGFHFGISLAGIHDKIWILQCLGHAFISDSIWHGISRFGSLESIKYTYKLYNKYIYDILYILRDNPRYLNIILKDSLFVSKTPYDCFRSATYDDKLYNIRDTSTMSDDQLKLYKLIDNIQRNGQQVIVK